MPCIVWGLMRGLSDFCIFCIFYYHMLRVCLGRFNKNDYVVWLLIYSGDQTEYKGVSFGGFSKFLL